MDGKNMFASKSMWFGAGQVAFGIVGLMFGWIDGEAAMGLITLGIGTIALRFQTTQPIR